jgi:cytoskeletal protein CcmA (bactofilin family)
MNSSKKQDSEQPYEFYVGVNCVMEGAVLEIGGVARIDGRVSGTIKFDHLIVGQDGYLTGDISGNSADVKGTLEDTINLTGKLSVRSSGRVSGKISYGTIEANAGAKLVGEITTDYEPSAAGGDGLSDLSTQLTGSLDAPDYLSEDVSGLDKENILDQD